jgi:predicted ester cyclase
MALARHFIEARGKADLDAMEQMMAPDFVDHTLAPDQQLDRESYKRSVAEYVSAFSNIRILVEDQVAAGDKVVTRFVGRSTHDRGELMGVAPTGMELTNRVIVIHRISGGKIAEEWGVGTSISELREGFAARMVHLAQERIERERVEQELRVARRIQQASLPKEVPTLEGWQIAYHYQPARVVGGDFYDFHFLSEGRGGLVVGDATGKGVPAALVMSTTCGMLRLAAQSYSSPGEMLQRVNEALFP